MKILTATDRTQGTADNDFTWVDEGEILTLGFVCGRDQSNPDGGCGCGRSFSGAVCHKATTTALVVDTDMTRAEVIAHVVANSSWPKSISSGMAKDMLAVAAKFDAGHVIQRRLDVYAVRELVAA
ncbi:DUF7715 family protein [Leifsonia sp. Leaf264]|uniref:DUF7715 family protein n=1 Tax=Leifsonia sp. Leaf264 TaxID=1736314 RepID=UPI0006F75190|nr:hypothetical protein [Leifsonia sp. Leaf264]KQO98446.1 hypothetical protein ASF30_10315 [Leifsonia sp. Leaf264]